MQVYWQMTTFCPIGYFIDNRLAVSVQRRWPTSNQRTPSSLGVQLGIVGGDPLEMAILCGYLAKSPPTNPNRPNLEGS